MRFIKLDSNDKVIGVREGPYIVDGEIQSDTGELGQIMQEDGTFITPDPEPQPYVPTNAEIAQMISDLQADLIIAGVIQVTWYEKYMKNAVSITTLNKLVTAGILTQAEVDAMVADRLAQYGYQYAVGKLQELRRSRQEFNSTKT